MWGDLDKLIVAKGFKKLSKESPNLVTLLPCQLNHIQTPTKYDRNRLPIWFLPAFA